MQIQCSSDLAALIASLKRFPPEATSGTAVIWLLNLPGKLRLLLVVPEVKGVSFPAM